MELRARKHKQRQHCSISRINCRWSSTGFWDFFVQFAILLFCLLLFTMLLHYSSTCYTFSSSAIILWLIVVSHFPFFFFTLVERFVVTAPGSILEVVEDCLAVIGMEVSASVSSSESGSLKTSKEGTYSVRWSSSRKMKPVIHWCESLLWIKISCGSCSRTFSSYKPRQNKKSYLFENSLTIAQLLLWFDCFVYLSPVLSILQVIANLMDYQVWHSVSMLQLHHHVLHKNKRIQQLILNTNSFNEK